MNTSENQNTILPKGEKASADCITGTAWVNILVPRRFIHQAAFQFTRRVFWPAGSSSRQPASIIDLCEPLISTCIAPNVQQNTAVLLRTQKQCDDRCYQMIHSLAVGGANRLVSNSIERHL
jgi:hypothetical protein